MSKDLIYRTDKQLCPYCGYLFDAVGKPTARMPRPGDMSLCLNCANLMVFLTQTTFRKPTEEELLAVSREPVWSDVRYEQEKLRWLIKTGFRTKAAQRGEGRPQ
jgi:hypothetical protein